jgi:hypothetical protein
MTVQLTSEIAGRWGDLASSQLSAYVYSDELQAAYGIEQLLGALVNEVGHRLQVTARAIGALQAYYPGSSIPELALLSNDVVAVRTFAAGQRLREIEPKLTAAFPNISNLPSELSSYGSNVLMEMQKYTQMAMVVKNRLSIDTEMIGTEDSIGHRFNMDEIIFPDGGAPPVSAIGVGNHHAVGDATLVNFGGIKTEIGNGKWLVTFSSGAVPNNLQLMLPNKFYGKAMFRIKSIPFNTAGTSVTALLGVNGVPAISMSATGVGVFGDLASDSSALYLVSMRSNVATLSLSKEFNAAGYIDGVQNADVPIQLMVECLWLAPTDSHSFELLTGIATGTELKALIGTTRPAAMLAITRSKKWFEGVELESYIQRYSPDRSSLYDSLRNYYEGVRTSVEPDPLPPRATSWEWYFGEGTLDGVVVPTQRKLYGVWHDWMVAAVAALAVSPSVARELQSGFM